MLKVFRGSICAGILISIGGSVFLACENRYIGAVLFCVALLCICYKEYILFTGKVGYLVENHTKSTIIQLFAGLFGNIVTTSLLGLAVRYAIPAIGTAAESVCAAKLTQAIPQTLIRAVFCGVLMYLAVSIFRDCKTPMGILFCIPVFILSGFEHSIADMFYFGASGMFGFQTFAFMAAVIFGNSIGGVLLPLIRPDVSVSAQRKCE